MRPPGVVEGVQPDPMRNLAPGEPRYHSCWRTKPPGAYFDKAAAEWAVAFFERQCCLTTDEWARKPFILGGWQADWIIRQAFGWRRENKTRLYRRVMVWIPRKNGKTELMAGVSHLCLMGDGVHGAECYSIASTGDQATLVFESAKKMARYSATLGEEYEVFEDSLYLKATQSRFEPLTGKAKGKHGLKTTYLLGDEVHEWPDSNLYTYVRNAMASRAEPMEWLISTAGLDEGYGVDLWNESIGICEGSFDDPETLVLIWCAPQDPKVEIDIEDPQVWAEANPNLGVSVRLDYMIRTAREAAQSPAKENDFKRYHLNIWTGQNERWLPMTAWNACAQPSTTPDLPRWKELETLLAGQRCYIGLDLASTRDFCAESLLFPPNDAVPTWSLLVRLWWPDAQFRIGCQKTRVPFEEWRRAGAIRVTPGNAADHDAICDQVIADCQTFDVQHIGIDQFMAHSVALRLTDEGLPVELIRWGMLSMGGPTKTFELRVLKGDLDHGGQPALRWMASNVSIKRDGKDNYMPDKAKSAQKIDGIAATVVAEAVAQLEVQARSYLETNDLMVLQ